MQSTLSPPAGPTHDDEMAPVVRRNISALAEVRAAEDRRRTTTDRTVDAITGFVGSMGSVYAHAGVIGLWVAVNVGLVPGVRPFDRVPFNLLTTGVGIEAIFLAMFILITQNRARVLDDRRAELSLQIGLLTEHELTRAIHLLDAVADHLRVRHGVELSDVKRDVQPEQVVEEIVRAEDAADAAERA